jgi:hypothetical protein
MCAKKLAGGSVKETPVKVASELAREPSGVHEVTPESIGDPITGEVW